jgi:DHA2 family multidrug resistance protein
MGPVDPITQALIAPMVERAALTQACNEAWWVLGGLFLLALLLLPAMHRQKNYALTSST